MTDVLASADDVRAWLATHVYAPRTDDPVTGAVGVEVELFPFWRTAAGGPAARLALVEVVGIVDGIGEATRDPDTGDGRPSWHLDGALITEEPGAQVEVAGPPDGDADAAMERVERVVGRLRAAFEAEGAALAAAGLDLWSADDDVPVQLDVPRYEAMTTYFGRRGGREGHLLMCASCSIQVNLDLGPPEVARERWRCANLVAPVLTAVFAASPTDVATNGRAHGWRGLDPTRTGVSPSFLLGADDPVDHVLADALRADVMMVRRGGTFVAGRPGRAFADWIRDGDPDLGRPTTADLELHLTTLFPEARLRGFMEVRTVDALPAPWRTAAVALVTGLLYDGEATARTVRRLGAYQADLPRLLDLAAESGVHDRELGELAGAVMEDALDGAARLGLAGAEAAEAYLDRYTRRGRAPADDLRVADRGTTVRGFTWACG